jgi:hypothetical protein
VPPVWVLAWVVAALFVAAVYFIARHVARLRRSAAAAPPAAAPVADQQLVLGGRPFMSFADKTVQNDFWLMQHLRRSGLERIVINAAESPDDFGRRLFVEMLEREDVFELLGGFLVPGDRAAADWTPAMAVETGQYLRQLTAPEDKAQIQNMVITLLIDFFATGLSSLERLQTSTRGAEPASGRPATTMPTPTDAGTSSSASSPGRISTAPGG